MGEMNIHTEKYRSKLVVHSHFIGACNSSSNLLNRWSIYEEQTKEPANKANSSQIKVLLGIFSSLCNSCFHVSHPKLFMQSSSQFNTEIQGEWYNLNLQPVSTNFKFALKPSQFSFIICTWSTARADRQNRKAQMQMTDDLSLKKPAWRTSVWGYPVSASEGMRCASWRQGYIPPPFFLGLVFPFFLLFFSWKLKGELYLYGKCVHWELSL